MPAAKFSQVRKLLEVLRFERSEIFAIYFYAILAGGIHLTLPLGIQSIISFVQGGAISTSLVLLIIFVIVGVALTGLFQVNVMKIVEKIQQQLFVRYAFSYSETIPKLNLDKIHNVYLPEVTNGFFDVASLQKGIGKLLLDVPAASIQILAGLLLLSFYHPSFIAFAALLILVLLLIFRFTGSSGLASSLEESNFKYSIAAQLQELARSVITLRFSRNETAHLHRTDVLVSKYIEARTRHFHILKLQYWTLIGFKLLITAAMLILGAALLINQQLSIGQFIAVEIVILMVISSVEKLIVNLDNVYDVLTSVEKLSKLLEKPQQHVGKLKLAESKTAGVEIFAQNLSFGYHPEVLVIRDASFLIKPGQKVAISGEYGVGKSTLLRLLAGLYSGYSGRLNFNGSPINSYDTGGPRKSIGLYLQGAPDLIEGSILDNISIGAEHVSMTEIEMLARLTGLHQYILSKREGFQHVLQPMGKSLPNTVVRQIMLTRALQGKPALLLLDEPFLGFPASETTAIKDYLLKGLPETTIIIVTDEVDFAAQCDHQLDMKGDGIISFQ